MSETFKLSEMQRTNIEFERQRHLANWLVKSSPHMAAAAAAGVSTPPSGAAANTSKHWINRRSGAPSNSVAAATAVAAACNGGAPAGAHPGHMAAGARKPKLRRFNSHDTSSNMFSVAEFENARLARRNEIELNQRLARRLRNKRQRHLRPWRWLRCRQRRCRLLWLLWRSKRQRRLLHRRQQGFQGE
ncbi:GL25698 [Drosophila persimilis]|uniref:GL25698 n=1 Tax=Drosophila persimilis TaxID=7234 RepID=B4GKE2_DROPE|nr:GL25698 [Drosophila persimilis]